MAGFVQSEAAGLEAVVNRAPVLAHPSVIFFYFAQVNMLHRLTTRFRFE